MSDMSPLFKQAVVRYFTEKLGVEVGEVEFEYDDGWDDVSQTYEDDQPVGHFDITVHNVEGKVIKHYDNKDAASFLTELFTWEETHGI